MGLLGSATLVPMECRSPRSLGNNSDKLYCIRHLAFLCRIGVAPVSCPTQPRGAGCLRQVRDADATAMLQELRSGMRTPARAVILFRQSKPLHCTAARSQRVTNEAFY